MYQIFSDFINIANIGLHYEDKFEEYDITHVIVHKNARLNIFLPRDNNYKQIRGILSIIEELCYQVELTCLSCEQI